MATFTITSIVSNHTGNNRTVAITFTATDTTGDLYTSLENVEFADAFNVNDDTAVDLNYSVSVNSKSVGSNDGNPGWVHFTGLVTNAVYQLTAEGY